MNIVILYDSTYGNTKKIADVMQQTISRNWNSNVRSLKNTSLKDIKKADVLVVGSPTQGGRPTKSLAAFLKTVPNHYLDHTRIATFDTRIDERKQGMGLRMLMKIIGYAAPRLATILQDKGAKILTSPTGFYVTDTEGPLKKGELNRARLWIEDVIATADDDTAIDTFQQFLYSADI